MCLHHCPSTVQGCRRTPVDHCHTGARCVTLQTTNRQEERDTSSVNNMFTTCKQHVYWIQTNKHSRKETDHTTHDSPTKKTTHRSPRILWPSPGWRFHLTGNTVSVFSKRAEAGVCHQCVAPLNWSVITTLESRLCWVSLCIYSL